MHAKLLFAAGALVVLGSAIPPPAQLREAIGSDVCGVTISGACAQPTESTPTLPYDLPVDTSVTLPPIPPVKLVVSLPQQRVYLYREGALLDTAPVSTGMRGHETPVGTFRILEKQVHHRSNIYSNAPMPFMERLTQSGVALHAGHLPGYRASHGCIRLPWSFAKKLYGITTTGTPVVITNERVPARKYASWSGRASRAGRWVG